MLAKPISAGALAVCAIFQSAYAQKAQAPLEFKGVPFGATAAEFAAKHDYFTCYRGNPCEEFYLDDVPGRQVVIASYAGERVKRISVEFLGGELALVFIVIFPESFDAIVATLAAKYGKPKIIHSKVQNRLGITFEQKEAHWDRKDGMIMAKKYGSQVDAGNIMLASKKWLDKSMSDSRTTAADVKSDV